MGVRFAEIGKLPKRLSDIPTIAELHKLTVDELVGVAKHKRSIRFPFKQSLICYIRKLGKLF